MKKLHHLFLWAFLAFSSSILAQVDSSGPQGIIDTVFSGLDTGKISTGLLADKTVSLYVDLKSYDGTTDNPISFDDAMTLPLVIRNMDMKGNVAPDEKTISTIYEQHNRNNLVVPLVFDYVYNKIDDNAISDGLIDTSKTVWTDTIIAGKIAYIEKNLKATALNFNYSAGSTMRFMYDPRVYFTNKIKPAFLLIDFDDGTGLQKVAAFDTITITYTITGKHSITFNLPDLNSDVPDKINISVFDFKPRPNRENNPDCAFMFKSDQTVYKWNTKTKIIGYDNNGDPIFGTIGEPLFMEALVSIQMGLDKKGGAKHQCLKKPLLFIDGIDFGYKDHIDQLFKDANKCNTLGYDNFANAADVDPITGEEVQDMRFANGPEFVKKATEAGYDIIFFDFLYGAADIRLNANLLEDFIVKLNGGNLNGVGCYCGKTFDEIVVVGASMGGQVARYALLKMEANKINHCVREWVSFDSPNEGANIPLGLQHFVEWSAASNDGAFNIFKSSVDNLNRKLDRDASKQLLTYHHSDKNQSKSHWMYYDFYTEMDKMGKYPVKCRKAAVANGSLNAKQQDYGTSKPVYGGGELLAELNVPLNVLFKLRFNYHAKIYSTEGTAISGGKCNYDANNKYVIDAYKEKWFPSRIAPLYYQLACDPVSFKGYGFDYASGGTSDGILSLDQTIPLTKLFKFTPGIIYHNEFGFIPSVSSIAVNPDIWTTNSGASYNIIANYGIDKLEKHLPNYGVTPFDAIYGPYGGQINEPHVFISKPLITWAIDELAMGDYENTLSANGNGGNTYNFGDLYFNRLKSITVNAACSLKVFADDYKGYKNRKAGYESQYYASIDKPADKTLFELLTNEDCEPTHVKINNGGYFGLGDGKNRQAITRFRNGSTLELMEGATLHILNGSALIIESGAKLIFHRGAHIVLDGENAVLQLYGELQLPDANTKFTFEHSAASQNGFIDFVNSPVISTKGSNNTIELIGTGVASKIARISGNLILKGLHVQPNDAFLSITLKNGEVQFLGKSSLKTDAAFTASFVNFTGSGTSYGNSGLVLYGQPNIDISNCRFQNLTTGFEMLDTYSPGILVVLQHNLFNNCTTGAMIVKVPVIISASNFINCGIGAKLDLSARLKVENTSFSNNGTALYYIGNSAMSGVVKSCHFRLNSCAIRQEGSGAELTIACTDISNCMQAIFADGNINMSKLKADRDYAIIGGECNLYNNDYFFVMNYGTLDLYNGNNNIVQGNPAKVTNFVSGNIDANALALLVFPPNVLEVENNYWSPNPATNPTLYNFIMVTNLAMYTGVLGINNSVTSPYSNCASASGNGGGGAIGDLNGGISADPVQVLDDLSNNFEQAAAPAITPNGIFENGALLAYPIPASEYLNIELNDGDQAQINCITLTNSEGKEQEASYTSTGCCLFRVNVNNFTNGSYTITITTNQKVYRKQIIVLHE